MAHMIHRAPGTTMSMSVAEMLGIEAVVSPMSLIRQIEKGLPLSALERVSEQMAPNDLAFRSQIIPRATWTRRKKGDHLSPSESEIVARLAQVWGRAVEVYQDPDAARRFLNQPHPLLEGRAPIDVAVATSAGANLVESILGRLLYGSAP